MWSLLFSTLTISPVRSLPSFSQYWIHMNVQFRINSAFATA